MNALDLIGHALLLHLSRAALHGLRSAQQQARLAPGQAVVAMTGGNFGAGRAVVGAMLGHPVVLACQQATERRRPRRAAPRCVSARCASSRLVSGLAFSGNVQLNEGVASKHGARKLIAVPTRGSVLVRKGFDAIQALSEPNACSTVCRRSPPRPAASCLWWPACAGITAMQRAPHLLHQATSYGAPCPRAGAATLIAWPTSSPPSRDRCGSRDRGLVVWPYHSPLGSAPMAQAHGPQRERRVCVRRSSHTGRPGRAGTGASWRSSGRRILFILVGCPAHPGGDEGARGHLRCMPRHPSSTQEFARALRCATIP